MEAPVLTCVQFAEDGQTCTQTQWVQPPQPVFPPLSADAGQQLGFAIMAGAVAIWASKLPGGVSEENAMSKLESKFAGLRARFDRRVQQVAVGGFLLGCSAASFAADGDIDVSDSILKIGAGLAAAILVSVAMTGAVISVKASKLPRRGA